MDGELKMKKFLCSVCCIVLLAAMVMPIFAVEVSEDNMQVVSREESVLDSGIRVIIETSVSQEARAANRTYSRTGTYYWGDTMIAKITIQGTFYYDGSTVRVVSKSVTQSTTYDGWSYTQKSFTSSGGTITLEGKLSKLLVLNQAVEMSLSCDVNGNIT